MENIRTLSIVDFVNQSRASARLKNSISKAHAEKRLPFETIGDFFDQGSKAKSNLLKIRDLGKGTAEEFISLVEKATGVAYFQSKEPQAGNYNEQVRGIKIFDLINQNTVSVRLKNCVDVTQRTTSLPFETIGEYLDAEISAKSDLFKIKNFGRKTADELAYLIKMTLNQHIPEKPKHKKRLDLVAKLSERFPGVFDPLIEQYTSVPEEEVLKLEQLETVILNLCDKKSTHAEMVWFRFAGETLEEVGKNYGVTRERVRQVTAKYEEFVVDVNSPIWTEKAVRYLITESSTGNRLPENSQLDKYHPKLAQSLVRNFALVKSGELTPRRRLEIAQALQLDVKAELLSQKGWTLEKIIYEIKKTSSRTWQADVNAHAKGDAQA